jgi:hypothetical protein
VTIPGGLEPSTGGIAAIPGGLEPSTGGIGTISGGLELGTGGIGTIPGGLEPGTRGIGTSSDRPGPRSVGHDRAVLLLRITPQALLGGTAEVWYLSPNFLLRYAVMLMRRLVTSFSMLCNDPPPALASWNTLALNRLS